MNWNADQYHEIQSKYQFPYGQKLISRLLEFIELSSKTILDVGCGEGLLTCVLNTYAGKTGKVIGIDRDKDMIAYAICQHSDMNFI